MRTVTVAGKRLLIHEREDWQLASQPVTGPEPLPSLVHWAVIHWPGASVGWIPPSDVASHLRWSQAMYKADPNRGYSYGYGFVIGPNPIDWSKDPVQTDIWEVRGFDIRIASNDGDNGMYGEFTNPNFNGRSNSCQIMASENHPATNDQILQARYYVAMSDDVYGEVLQAIPHRVSDATSCPGNYITSKMPVIATRPTGTVPVPIPTPVPVPSTKKKGRTVYAVIAHVSGTNAYVVSIDGGLSRQTVRTPNHMKSIIDAGAKFVESGTVATDANWGTAPVKTNAQLDDFMGKLTA